MFSVLSEYKCLVNTSEAPFSSNKLLCGVVWGCVGLCVTLCVRCGVWA